MPAILTLVLFLYAVLLLVAGAALWATALAGGIAVLWQALVTFSAGFAPPPTAIIEPGSEIEVDE